MAQKLEDFSEGPIEVGSGRENRVNFVNMVPSLTPTWGALDKFRLTTSCKINRHHSNSTLGMVSYLEQVEI